MESAVRQGAINLPPHLCSFQDRPCPGWCGASSKNIYRFFKGNAIQRLVKTGMVWRGGGVDGYRPRHDASQYSASDQEHENTDTSKQDMTTSDLPDASVLRHVVDVHCHPTDAPSIPPESIAQLQITVCAMSTMSSDQQRVRDLATSHPTKVVPCFGQSPVLPRDPTIIPA